MSFEPKPIKLLVINSQSQRGMLSVRLLEEPHDSGTAVKRALSASGLKAGDIVELRYVGEVGVEQ